MHLVRKSAVVTTLACLAAGAHLVACGGDGAKDPASDGARTEATADASAPAPAPGPTLTVSTSRGKVYLGQTAKLDGAKIAPEVGAEHAWTIVAAPSDSAIKTENIQDRATVSPSFEPDALGSYTLQLSGRRDGVSASVLVIVEVIDAPVFYRELATTEEQLNGKQVVTMTSSTHVIGAHRRFGREVGCPVTLPTDASLFEDLVYRNDTVNSPTAMIAAVRASGVNGDTWEAPPGTPSRVVFTSASLDPSRGVLTSSLVVATSESGCGSPDAKNLDTTEKAYGDRERMVDSAHLSARFSPNGNRIAFEQRTLGKLHLSSIGFDGKDKHELSDLEPWRAEGDPPPLDPLAVVPMRWKDDTHVGWISYGDLSQQPAVPSWELWTTEDSAGATPSVAMRCSDSGVRRFDFLPNGDVVALVGREQPAGLNGVLMDLVVYRANPTTKACELVENLTNNTGTATFPMDFALSPDKSEVVFTVVTYDTADGGLGPYSVNLATVPVDGSRAAAPLPGGVGADLRIGPRWAAGGSMITWGRGSQPAVGALAAIPKGGGERTDLTVGTSDIEGSKVTTRTATGIGQGCSVMPGTIANDLGSVLGGLAIVALVARRRRRA